MIKVSSFKSFSVIAGFVKSKTFKFVNSLHRAVKALNKLITFSTQVYRIDVFTQERNWCVYRRYSEFRKLHDKISESFKMFKGSFPPKQLSGNLSPAIIEQRRSSLEHYLLKIVNWSENDLFYIIISN